jgi:hypothetical protein
VARVGSAAPAVLVPVLVPVIVNMFMIVFMIGIEGRHGSDGS